MVVLVEGLERMNLTLITHLVAAMVAASAAWAFQGARMDAAVADVRLEMSEAKTKAVGEKLQAVGEKLQAVKEARADERAINKTYVEALNAARIRETTLRRDVAAAGAQSDGLREQAAEAARRLAAAPPAAVLEYATAVNQLFADCSRSYQELAGKADGHAADVETLRDAWPSKPR